MNSSEDIRWFGVRSLCLFGKKDDGRNIFEERVLVFSGKNSQEALAKAQAELDQYANCHNTIAHPALFAYEQDGDPLIDGYEVWSQLYETSEDIDSFFESRYSRYQYHDDD
jgi:hypothetical protein